VFDGRDKLPTTNRKPGGTFTFVASCCSSVGAIIMKIFIDTDSAYRILLHLSTIETSLAAVALSMFITPPRNIYSREMHFFLL